MNGEEGAPVGINLLERAVQGSLYGIGAALLTWTLAGMRLVLLARLLPPQVFGTATQSLILVGAAVQLLSPGLNEAILQRPHVGPVELATYRRLKWTLDLFVLFGLALLVHLAPVALGSLGLSAVVLWGYLGVEALRALQAPATIVRMRALDYRRLRAADVAASAAMTVVAPGLAFLGWGVWALVAEPAAAQLARIAVLGRASSETPQRLFDQTVAADLLRFGRKVWATTNLGYLLDHFGSFWTGRSLGSTALGHYSRGFEVATLPRRIGVQPALGMLLPLASGLQSDRPTLGRAFRVTLSILVRLNLAFALPLAIAADDLVPWVLGEVWRPIVPVLRVLLLYLLVDPLARIAASLLIAVGEPGVVVRTRGIQAALLVPAVIVGADHGILGVAIATTAITVGGAVALLVRTCLTLGATLAGVWLWPTVAVGLASLTAQLAWAGEPGSDPAWNALARAGVALVVFAALLWWRERSSAYDAAKRILVTLRAERER